MLICKKCGGNEIMIERRPNGWCRCACGEEWKNGTQQESATEMLNRFAKEDWLYNGRDIVFKVLVGSHNYNLADERSDKDYKVWVAPTLDDMVFNKMISKVSEKDGDDTEYKDIRALPKLLLKSNINFTEILFSTEILVNPKYQKLVNVLLENRENIAGMNKSYWFDSARGIAMNCRKRILSTKRVVNNDLVEKHGYDTKEAMKVIRVLDFLVKYQVSESFQNSFTYGPKGRTKLLMIKQGGYTLDQFYELADYYEEKVEKLRDWYKSKTVDNTTLDLLNKTVKDMCLLSIKNDL